MRYLNYVRFNSNEPPERQIQSIADQLADTRRLQREMNLNVIEEMAESKSARDPERPVFNRMISMLQKGEADAILCSQIEKLTRNLIDTATLLWLMRQGKLKEIRTPYRVYTPDDNAVITAVESVMAEQYTGHPITVNVTVTVTTG